MGPIEPEAQAKHSSFYADPVARPFPAGLGPHSLTFEVPRKKVLMELKLLAEGLSLRGTSRVLEIKLDTIRRWLATAALHGEQVSDMLLRDLKLSQVQVDELWTFVKKKQQNPNGPMIPRLLFSPKRAGAEVWGTPGSGEPLPRSFVFVWLLW